MNAYEMIMRAADNIEKYPGRFNFQVTRLPQNEHDPACYLGEMLRVLGVTKGINVGDFTQSMLGLREGAFFEELAKIHGGGVPMQFDPNDPRVGVPLLRKFAKRYEGIPDEVRAIFNPPRLPFKVVTWSVMPGFSAPPMPKGAFYNIATDSYEMAPA